MPGYTEFDIIKDYFTRAGSRDDVSLGVGDDCAVVKPPAARLLAVTVDTLVSGVHFPLSTSAADVAYKSIAVNLSDLSSMGAQPAWLTLALTLPDIDPLWLQEFADSFHQTCVDYGVQLVGGDTTQGPLAITVQATGFIEPDRVMRRDRARPGDRIYVTGTLGDAAMALEQLSDSANTKAAIDQFCLDRLNRPLPRVAFGFAASRYCRCAIDISDGLLADLGHILAASGCGAEINLQQLPVSSELSACYAAREQGRHAIDWNVVLSGGDDYELCLAVTCDNEASLLRLAEASNTPLTCIGEITDGDELVVLDQDGKKLDFDHKGFVHFNHG